MLLAACAADETVSGYTQGATQFTLQSLNGAPFPARATIDLSTPGRVTGDGPCNSYSGRQTVPYPWIEINALTATERACPALSEEAAFFNALAGVTLAEISGGTLILSNLDGREMVFHAAP